VALLLLAIIAGLLAGLARAQLNHRSLRVPPVRLIWLVLAAFLAQAVIFQLPATRRVIPEGIASGIFIGAEVILLTFIWMNRQQPGFWALGMGLVLNLLAICLNGGWMPVSTQTISQLFPNALPGAWQIGKRFGFSKDLVLDGSTIKLGFLADRFMLPGWIPYRVAFSLGDIFIAFGAFLLLWSIGSPSGRPVDPTT
jgi:hypothetical protein